MFTSLHTLHISGWGLCLRKNGKTLLWKGYVLMVKTFFRFVVFCEFYMRTRNPWTFPAYQKICELYRDYIDTQSPINAFVMSMEITTIAHETPSNFRNKQPSIVKKLSILSLCLLHLDKLVSLICSYQSWIPEVGWHIQPRLTSLITIRTQYPKKNKT